MVTPLGSIPDKAAHQDGGFRFDCQQFTFDPATADVGAEEADLSQALAGIGEQRRGRDRGGTARRAGALQP